MKYPNFNEEKKLWNHGLSYVIGLDEAGRGPLAGPVVAAAVCLDYLKLKNLKIFENWKLEIENLGVRDSKKLSSKKRELLYETLTSDKFLRWGIGVVWEDIIDKVNILEATKLAMKIAVDDIFKKYGNEAEFLIIDGNFILPDMNISQKSIISADSKVFSCSASGIIAKVSRDNIMKEMHLTYPDYGFDKHKGYGTKAHIDALKNLGPCKIHRKTFYPVSSIYKSQVI
ncbi:MAG: ribonuclease HII [Candidatus Staskawiczbacteria bacterium]|nr:ribonuclease HII [Candidatus Staskawiczbacteria bacterium]